MLAARSTAPPGNIATPKSTSGDAFGGLIAPVEVASFFAQTFERGVLHVPRGDAAYFDNLYSVARVEDALDAGADRPDAFALHKRGAPAISRDEWTSERGAVRAHSRRPARENLDPRRILAAFEAGYTLVVNDAAAFDPPLARLCNRITAQLGFYVHANAYMTPAGAQGFDTHYDTHGTLIAQIEGTKDWCVYAPLVALPTERQPYDASLHAGKLGVPREIRLAAGDSLYIPQGVPHHARTAERRSLHLTFAFAPIRLVDLLDALVQIAAREEPELRRALPPGWHRDPSFAAHVHDRLAAIVPDAIAAGRIPVATERAFNDLFAATRTAAHGTFDTLAAFNELGPASLLRLRDDVPFELRARADRLEIVLAADVISVPVTAQPGLDLLAAGPAVLRDISAVLPAGEGRELVHTLVLAGLIEIDNGSTR